MRKLISVIIPVYNEGRNIKLLYRELKEVFETLKEAYDFRVVFIDDGSTDNSWSIIKQLGSKDSIIRGISLSRNFGHQAALEAGLNFVNGDAVIMMDGDLQHPPRYIPQLIKKWEQGYDIVNTKRIDDRYGDGFIKKICSCLFYQILNTISEVKVEEGMADFRLIDRKIVNIINNLGERHKFYRGLVNWVGFKTCAIQYSANKRFRGASVYTFRKMFNLAQVGITSFSTFPMKIIVSLGTLLAIGSTILLVIMFYVRWFVNEKYFSPLSFLVVIIVLTSGITLMGVGITALYLLMVYKQVQGRPSYIVSEKMNL